VSWAFRRRRSPASSPVPHVKRSNALDADNASVNYRVWLAGSDVLGKEYGTEVTRLVLGYALDTVGLHRLSLSVFDFNPRAASTRNAASDWKVACARACCATPMVRRPDHVCPQRRSAFTGDRR